MGEASIREPVSVIIPAHNAERTLPATLRSACAQQGVELEIIVVDDGSTDRTVELAEAVGPPVRVVRQVQAGVGAARNRALAEARGRWVAFLDADDIWLPDKLRLQLQLLAAQSDRCSFCYTGIELIDQAGNELPPTTWSTPSSCPEGWVFRRMLLDGNFVSTSSVLVARALVERVGPFLTDRSYSEDYDMWLRLARWTPFAYVSRPLVRYRLDLASYSHADPRVAARRSLRTITHNLQPSETSGLLDRLALRRRRAGLFYDAGCDLDERGWTGPAVLWLLRSFVESPLATRSGLHLAALALPRPVRRLLQHWRGRAGRG